MTRRLVAFVLVAGSAGLAVAVAAAHAAPARGYELSLYASTPTATWAGLAVAVAAGVIAAFAAPRTSRLRDAGLVLIGGGGIALTTMPVLRGYRFYGPGDSLSHLGWAREIAAGSLPATDLLYPGIHSLTVVVSTVTGVSPSLAMQYVVSVGFPAVFLLTVPLVVRMVTDSGRAYAIGLVAAALFVPINNVSVHPTAHPASQGVLFLPMAVLVALVYVFDAGPEALTAPVAAAAGEDADVVDSSPATDGGDPTRVSGVGALLGLVSAAIVLIHPQQAMNLTFVFVAVAALQLIYRRWRPGHRIASHRWLGPQTAVIAVLFLLWAPRFERVRGTVSFTVGNLLGGDSATGEVVAAKSTSLVALGGSVPTLFVRLFLAGTVLSLVAGAVLLAAVSGRLRDGWTDASVRYLGSALVPLAGIFLLVFAVGSGDQYFRYQGFIMVFITVLGAVGLAIAADRLDGRLPDGAGRALVAVLLVVLVPVAGVGYHASPYMYQASDHVPESRIEGYGTAFEQRQPGVTFVGIRGGPRRYVDYHYGTERARTELEFPGYRNELGGEAFSSGDYDEGAEEPRYLTVTRSAHRREVDLYDGFRYSAVGFERLETTPGVNRVQSSDGLSVYLIRPDGEPSEG